MIGQKRFNWAMVLALIAVLVFSYIAFLGMLYHETTNSNAPVWKALGILVIVPLCCFGMCYGKAKRNKFVGKSVQIALGIIIFGILGLGTIPFTNFLDVLGKSKEIHENVDNVFDYASNLDNRYAQYANSRIKDYEFILAPVVEESEGSFFSTSHTSELDYENSLKSQALRRIILPESRKSIIDGRQQWLEESKQMSLWNVATPDNLRKLKTTVNSWIEEYHALSSNGFDDESFNPFVEENFTSSIDSLMVNFTQYKFPSIIAILITLLVYGIILLPYFLTDPWKYGGDEMDSKGDGTHKEFTWI